ncbi:UDP-Glc:alpha-D-GlcNAc-diphosphoundecaprenol beta-1,3-glucosyltransferase WfaP [Flavobacterium anhuiense]|uniref:UDP-Glc:alpha-D-GlcNAc-diphosphoundecaprenol beta-1,3-glucosyltransferase WfaP n=1 Tax=Flavobacterium anhuiense TaxID=459526 RepID=A0AAC9GIH6_9FLAO|nr:glycosyltransferase family A protein [Flavobacterium anhuiense]AOC95313.1 UDP-Glc:alpha-D-GlcNAc-diphosphoundecaprenol beta-1,3-glucosyltransferase WfaP [Flavobacterium anhuiense]
MLVSIIIPVHKTIDYFKSCVESALLQSYSHIEVIIACNGELEIQTCKDFLNINDPRLIYLKTKPGRHNARNEGLLAAKGKYIQFLDYDDLLYLKKIETQVSLLKSANSKEIISITKWKKFKNELNESYNFPYNNIFEEEKIDARKLIRKLSVNGGFIATGSWLIPKVLIGNIQWIDSPNDDAVFLSGILKGNPEIIMVSETYAGYRIHDENTSSLFKKSELDKLLVSWELIYQNLKALHIFEVKLYLYKAYLNLIRYSKVVNGYRILFIIYKTLMFGFKSKLGFNLVLDLKRMLLK